MIQAGLDCAVFVAAAANIRVRRSHDKELVEIPLWQELKQHADWMFLGNHTQQANHVRMLQFSQDRRLL